MHAFRQYFCDACILHGGSSQRPGCLAGPCLESFYQAFNLSSVRLQWEEIQAGHAQLSLIMLSGREVHYVSGQGIREVHAQSTLIMLSGCEVHYPSGQGVREVHAEHAAGLIAPAAGDIAHGVPAPTKHQHGHIELGQELDAVGVALQAEVEAPQAVP